MKRLTTSYARGPEFPVRDLTVGQLLNEAAELAPDRVALVFGSQDPLARRTWTYRELEQQAVLVARALRVRFEPGEHIAVWAQNIPEWMILEFGCAMAGIVLVTVNPAYKASELLYVLTQSKSAGLFVVDSHRGNPMLEMAEAALPECPHLRELLRFADWDSFVASAEQFTGELPDVRPLDPMMIQYTSGTTGFPKGALLHHRGLVNNGFDYIDRMGINPGDVYLTHMPLFHTAGSVMSVLGSVSKQCTQILVEAFEPGLVLELCQTFRVNGLVGVPTMLVAILEHPTFEQTDLSSIKAVASGGSLVPEHLVRTFEERLQAPFSIVFGQTECSPLASMTHPDDTLVDKSQTIGPPMPNVEVKIVDPQTFETLPVGAVGEYCTRGYHVMHEYFDMPEQTAAAIDADGWLHTGDLAAMDDRGYCSIEGRLKDMIIRGGENIYPRELEDLLFAHPSVSEVAVVGLPDEKWGETVSAFVRPTPGKMVNKDELFAYLRDHLAPHKTPKQWFAVSEFPLTGSGKIQKFKLREQWCAGDWEEL